MLHRTYPPCPFSAAGEYPHNTSLNPPPFPTLSHRYPMSFCMLHPKTLLVPKWKKTYLSQEGDCIAESFCAMLHVYKTNQEVIKQSVQIQPLTKQSGNGMETRSNMYVWWKADSYFIVCFSVKTTVTMILECGFWHHEYFTPGGETFNMHEKSCALGAAQFKQDGLWNYLQKSCSPRQAVEMELFACGTCLKPNSRGTPLPVRTAHLWRAAPAQGSVLLLHILSSGEFFETRFTFDRHSPLQLQSISVDTVAVFFMKDLGLHSSNWDMRQQHNGPNYTIVLGVTTKYLSLAFQVPNSGIVVQTDLAQTPHPPSLGQAAPCELVPDFSTVEKHPLLWRCFPQAPTLQRWQETQDAAVHQGEPETQHLSTLWTSLGGEFSRDWGNWCIHQNLSWCWLRVFFSSCYILCSSRGNFLPS